MNSLKKIARLRTFTAIMLLGALFLLANVSATFGQLANPAERKASKTKITVPFETINSVVPDGQACTNVIVDGGFEIGDIPSTTWDPETSTAFDTPVCDLLTCGNGAGASPPFAGDFWVWFGGTSSVENATIGQTVTIAANSTASLTFQMRAGTVVAPFTDVVNVRVDGTIVQSYVEPAVAETAYSLRTIDLSAFANGATHQILFEYIGPTTGLASFVIDDVALNVCPSVVVSGVTISGRVTTATGLGVSGAEVTLTDNAGAKRKILSSSFGYYSFSGVETPQTVTVGVTGKGRTFTPQTLSVNGNNLTDVNFIAQ